MTAVMDRLRGVGRKASSAISSSDISSRDLAIDAIVSEAGCTYKEADSTLSWISRFVTEARECDYVVIHPDDDDMSGREYEIFDLVVPHDGTAQPGSAHKAIEEALLDPSKDEFALSHSQITRGNREYCNVEVCIRVP